MACLRNMVSTPAQPRNTCCIRLKQLLAIKDERVAREKNRPDEMVHGHAPGL